MASVSSLDDDLRRKQDASYDYDLESEMRGWIESVTGTRLSGDFADAVKDGVALCNFANGLRSGSISKINNSTMPFKQMENVSAFLTFCERNGVSGPEMSMTVDLYEKKNVGQFLKTMKALQRCLSGVVAAPPASGKAKPAASSPAAKSSPAPSPTKASPAAKSSPAPAAGKASPGARTSNAPAGSRGSAAPSEDLQAGVTSGLDRDMKAKMAAKYDPDAAARVKAWIEGLTGDSLSSDLHESLKDGVSLCNLANAIRAGSVAKINKSSMAFKQMENIQSFLDFCIAVGMPGQELFMTVDLYEDKNMGQVLVTLQSLGRIAKNQFGIREP